MNDDREFTVILDTREDGGYRAWCPEFEGCFAQGDTFDEVLEVIGTNIAGRVRQDRFVLRPVPRVG